MPYTFRFCHGLALLNVYLDHKFSYDEWMFRNIIRLPSYFVYSFGTY